MEIGIVGLGFVGLVTATSLAHSNNKIIGIDVDKDKIIELSSGTLPFFEPGLDELFLKNKKNMIFSTDFALLKDVAVTFIVVPTPTINDKIDLSYVFRAAESIRSVNSNPIIIKSTVIPGTAEKIMKNIRSLVVSNPEFTREGTAVSDTLNPDRIIIGGRSKKEIELVKSIWKFTKAPMLITTNENAELIKYGNNTLLATLISFGNQLSNVSERIPNTDMKIILKGMSMDKRISCCKSYLTPGIGFGGSCFPKDTKALLALSKELGQEMTIVEDAIKTNEKRIDYLISIIKNVTKKPLRDIRIGILGLAFKEDTDDIRESQSIKLIRKLLTLGVSINAYDPLVKIEPVKKVKYFDNLEDCVKKSNLLIIANKSLIFRKLEKMHIKIPIIDGRCMLNKDKISNYVGIGLSKIKK